MQIEIYPPVGKQSAPFSANWFDLEVHKIQFSLSHKIHEYKIKDRNAFYMQGFEHSSSSMTISGVLTAESDMPGADLEAKKDSLILAASTWWLGEDSKIRTNCAQIKWRGWTQYFMIERLSFDKVAGETEEYAYELGIKIHEGK